MSTINTIPASAIVSVIPGVLGAGGTELELSGLVLTDSIRVPMNTVSSFASASDVGNYFGLTSDEYKASQIYFNGFDNSNVKPSAMLAAQYNGASSVAAYLRGGNVGGLGLAYLQAIVTGNLTVIMDGYTHTASSINLTGATSPSNAASLINSALTGSEPTEVSFTASLGAALTASVGSSLTTCTSSGTTLTVGGVGSGYLSPGDLVSGTDTTNSLPAGCYIVSQLTGTPGGSAGATFKLSAAATPGNLTSCTVTGTSTILDATAVTGFVSVGDTVTTISTSTTIVSQLTGTTGSTGTYQLSSAVATGIASESMVVVSNYLDVTVCATPSIAVGQTVVGSSITGNPVVTAQISGTNGGVGFYTISGVQRHVVSESMTGQATPPTVTYDSTSGGFLVTSGITGVPSTAAFATGTLSAALLLTAATGAVISQGAAATTPNVFMSALVNINRDWATFLTLQDPDGGSGNTIKLEFADWVATTTDRYCYSCWDSDASPTTVVPAVASMGYILAQQQADGTALIYSPDYTLAAFICGAVASIDFTETNGRVTLAFRSQSGLTASVTNQTVGNNLIANGYNFYGAYATAAQEFVFLYPGQVSGEFLWLDSYVDQIWLNNAFQLALMELLINTKSIPYNTAGYSLIEAACMDPINAGLNFGAFRPGVSLSAAQAAEVNNAAGVTIDATLSQRGWYLQVLDASAIVRQARGSPPCTFWYMDGQSCQRINLASIELL